MIFLERCTPTICMSLFSAPEARIGKMPGAGKDGYSRSGSRCISAPGKYIPNQSQPHKQTRSELNKRGAEFAGSKLAGFLSEILDPLGPAVRPVFYKALCVLEPGDQSDGCLKLSNLTKRDDSSH